MEIELILEEDMELKKDFNVAGKIRACCALSPRGVARVLKRGGVEAGCPAALRTR
jgi:hypothetical protein